MTSVFGLTAERQLEIEANSIVDARVVGDELILTTFGGTDINVGSVRGAVGQPGPPGSITSINGKSGSSVTLVVADIAGAATQTDLQNATTPAGSIMLFAGATPPSGWLTCDGSLYSRSAQARLYSAIGTAYGVGDNSTTFAVPDFRGRVPVGLNTGDATFDTLGETGGEKTHRMTIDEMPSHSHSYDQNNGRVVVSNTPYGGTNADDGGSSLVSGIGSGRYGKNIQLNGGTTGTGGGSAFNVLQPFIVARYIIKN